MMMPLSMRAPAMAMDAGACRAALRDSCHCLRAEPKVAGGSLLLDRE